VHDAYELDCDNCRDVCPHSVLVHYSYTNFYAVFGISSNYQYFVVCDQCDTACKVKKERIREFLPRLRIPFMRRWGLLVGVAIVFGIGALFLLVTEYGLNNGNRRAPQRGQPPIQQQPVQPKPAPDQPNPMPDADPKQDPDRL
jgi:hypothetical protein